MTRYVFGSENIPSPRERPTRIRAELSPFRGIDRTRVTREPTAHRKTDRRCRPGRRPCSQDREPAAHKHETRYVSEWGMSHAEGTGPLLRQCPVGAVTPADTPPGGPIARVKRKSVFNLIRSRCPTCCIRSTRTGTGRKPERKNLSQEPVLDTLRAYPVNRSTTNRMQSRSQCISQSTKSGVSKAEGCHGRQTSKIGIVQMISP